MNDQRSRKTSSVASIVKYLLMLALLSSCGRSGPPNVRKPDRPVILNVGDKVFLKLDADATMDGIEVDIDEIPAPATIVELNDEKVFLGSAWVPKGDVMTSDEALEYYSKKIQADPNNSYFWNWRALYWSIMGDCDNAIKDATEAIRLDPDDEYAYSIRASSRISNGDDDNAIKDLTEMIRLDPSNAIAYASRGSCWRCNNEIDKAITDLTEAIKLDPANVSFYAVRAEAWHEKDKPDKAIADYSQAIKLKPNDAAAYCDRGLVLSEQGQSDAAIKDLANAIRLDPTLARAFNNLAWTQATCPDDRFRDGNEAVTNATKACELFEWKDFGALDTLAAGYAETGDFKNAVKWQEKSLAGAPENEATGVAERLELYRTNQPYRDNPKRLKE